MAHGVLEHDFLVLWRLVRRDDPPETQYRFDADRKWRFDFAWPDAKVAVECEGGTASRRKKSRHTQPAGYQGDCTKYNAAAECGWRVLRYTADDVRKRSAEMLDQVIRVLNAARAGKLPEKLP